MGWNHQVVMVGQQFRFSTDWLASQSLSYGNPDQRTAGPYTKDGVQ